MEYEKTRFSQGNYKIAWDWLMNKYVPCTAMSLLKLRHEFNNNQLHLIEEHYEKIKNKTEKKT